MAISYNTLIPALKTHLPVRRLNQIGRDVQFIQRLRQIHASLFVWAVVLSRFGQGIPGFSEARQWYQSLGGAVLWPRPFQMRFKQASVVKLFERAFDLAVSTWRQAESPRPRHPLARWFPDVIAWDGSLVQVHDKLRRYYKGIRTSPAALKIMLAVSVFGNLPLLARLVSGNRHDMSFFPRPADFRKGTLWLFDKGFLDHQRLGHIDESGHFYLCPTRCNASPLVVGVRSAPAWFRKAILRSSGKVRLRQLLPKNKPLPRAMDLDVELLSTGSRRTGVRARLVILPGPHRSQHLYLTNLSPCWTPHALKELYRLRWQVELTFKELKQHLNLESLPTKDPHAVKVFVWASLIALAVSRTVCQWALPTGNFGLAAPLRVALVTRALRTCIRLLAAALRSHLRIAIHFLKLLREEILRQAKSKETYRPDSFVRLRRIIPLLGHA